MSKIKTVYKIMNKEGLFSTGGQSPKFSTAGKTWSSLNALKVHLAQFISTRYEYPNGPYPCPSIKSHYIRNPYSVDCRIVEAIVVIEPFTDRLKVSDTLDDLVAKRYAADARKKE